MKTIYNTYVVMESQEQCDRMKQLCLDNELPIWDNWNGWYFIKDLERGLHYDKKDNEFWCCITEELDKTQVTEEEFIELLKTK